MAAPILAGNTLAPVYFQKGFKYGIEYRGASQQLADGTTQFDLVSDTAKRTFVLTWKNITTAQRDTINTAYNAIRKASGAFTAPDGQTATVTRDPQQKRLDWDPEMRGDGTLLWSGSLTLVEA